jgi:signal transduction histidine kinase/DNA-binding NarL/FixJ family response regulator
MLLSLRGGVRTCRQISRQVGKLVRSDGIICPSYQNNINILKKKIVQLAARGIEFEFTNVISGRKVFYSATDSRSPGVVLIEAGVLLDCETKRINEFLDKITQLPPEQVKEGKLPLLETVEVYERTISGFREQNILTDQQAVSLAKDAWDRFIEIPPEKKVTEKISAFLETITKTDDNTTVQQFAEIVVDTLQKVWNTGNPNIMLYIKDENNQGSLTPTAIAMPGWAITWGHELRKKFLGEHNILIANKSKNLYVKAFIEGRVKEENNIPKDTLIKLAGDFIDDTILVDGKYWNLLNTIFFDERNTLLMVPLIHKGTKLGLATILKKGSFTPQERREIEIYLNLASYVISIKQSADRRLEIERIKVMLEMTRIIMHDLKNISWAGESVNKELQSLLGRMRQGLEVMRLESELNLAGKDDFAPLFEILKDFSRYVEDARGLWEMTVESGTRMLSISKGDKGKREFISIMEIKQLLSPFQVYAKNRGVEVIFDFSKNIDENKDGIKVVKSQLFNVFANLFTNSIEAFEELTDRTKQIRISIDAKNDKITILHKDNGIGISDHILKKLRLGESETTKLNGNGIGIGSIEQTVTENGGKFNITSVKDEGTMVTLYFPIKRKESRKSSAPAPAAAPKIGFSKALIENVTVMVVDDGVYLLRGLRKSLIRHGFSKVFTYMRPSDALDALNEKSIPEPQIIISDYLMLPDTGETFLSQAKEICGARPRLIMQTSENIDALPAEIKEKVAEIGIKLIEKGEENLLKALSEILQAEERIEDRLSNTPVFKLGSRIAHHISNLVTDINFETEGDPDLLKHSAEAIIELVNTYEQLKAFVDLAKPNFLRDRQKKLLSDFMAKVAEQSLDLAGMKEVIDGFTLEMEILIDFKFGVNGIERLPQNLREDSQITTVWKDLPIKRRPLFAKFFEKCLDEMGPYFADLRDALARDPKEWQKKDILKIKNAAEKILLICNAMQMSDDVPQEMSAKYASIYKIFGQLTP